MAAANYETLKQQAQALKDRNGAVNDARDKLVEKINKQIDDLRDLRDSIEYL